MTDEHAFPQSLASEGPFGGLTKREWIASRININPDLIPQSHATAIMGGQPPQWNGTAEDIESVKWWLAAEARYRFMLADAMIEEGKRKP